MSYLDKIKVADETYDIKDSSAAHSVNGQAPDASGNVAVAVPTKTSELENDSNFQNSTQTTATANAAVATHNTSNTAHADIRETLSGKQAALDTAQMAAVNSGADSTKVGQIATNATDISTINGKIPAAASSSNQLADKSFVNSTVQTASANFRGNWATWNDVPTDANDYPADADGNKTPTKNDYLVVQDASGFPTSPDPALAGTWRFKYSGAWATDGKNGWHPEYQVNETPLTSDQLAALNSGITADAVSKLGDLANIKSIGANLSLNNTTGELTATDTTYTAGTNVSISSGNVISATDTTYSNFVGTDGTAAGTAGLVPAPATTDAGKFLKADGTWDTAGSSVNVVQTTGTSTTDVMSQNAVTNALASKEDVGTTETLTIADTDWSALSSSDPYDCSATKTLTATIGANSTVELINDAAVDFATYGFAIGAVDTANNTVTFYSIGAPSASKTLKVNVKG